MKGLLRRSVKNVSKKFFKTQNFPKFLYSTPLHLEDLETEDEEISLENLLEEKDEEIERLSSLVEEYKDKYVKCVAEQENIRRIAREDVEKSRKYSVSSFASQVLDISDSMEMAIKSIDELVSSVELDVEEDVFKRLQTVFKGIELTHNILTTSLRKHSINLIETEKGEVFDPTLQEAVGKVETEDPQEVNTIVEIVKNGYSINDRTLRAVQVVVYVASPEMDFKEDGDI